MIIIVIWYKLLCFSTQIQLKVCWCITQSQRWFALTIIRILHHVQKQWGKMVLLTFFCTLPNVSLSIKLFLLQKHLLTRHSWIHSIQGWVSRLLKILRHLLISKLLASDFIMSQENLKHFRKKIGLQCYLSIPLRAKFIYENRMELNENKSVFKDLN